MRFSQLGQCQCKEVSINVTLPQQLSTYTPRECDCDFCTTRHIRYLSDPLAHLQIKSNKALTVAKQGAELANFLSCSNCGDFIAVVYPFKQALKGAVNATLLNDTDQLKSATVISPKKLTPNQKQSRWKELWMDVTIDQLETD